MLRRMIVATLAISALIAAWPAPAAAQGAGGLEGPLPAANMCGAGDGAEFTLAATGDTFPHENIQAVGEAQGYDVLFDGVRPFLQAADLAYTNFDGAMLAGAGISGYPSFNYSPALAAALKNAGVGLVSTANNHILDKGPEGLDATLSVLAESGIQQHGAVRSDAEDRPPYLPITLSRGGASITIGFISATWGTNGIPDPSGQVNRLLTSDDIGQGGALRQEILDAVALARRETDLVVVAAHWGQEYVFYPEPSQVDMARQLAEAGADVILGAQPHTLQPVDILDVGGRKALVIYSLANFLASQGAFQAQSFSATSVIFYVGLSRAADGAVRVTGYRYLPTIHVDGDTRPAPIPPGAEPAVIAHVRQMMRDPEGLRQLPADPPPGGRVSVCPSLTFAEAPDTPIAGDFAQHYRSLGGGALAVLGLPLGPAREELAGDCATPTQVLYTERQRLELHPEADWPFRVAGTQVGAEVFARRYPDAPLTRRTDLAAPDTFADPRFRVFYETNGGLPVFGYPISGPIEESDDAGAPRTAQYFERARFELAPGVAGQVQLGLLGREYPGIDVVCGLAAPAAAPTAESGQQALQRATVGGAAVPSELMAPLAQFTGGLGGWLPALMIIALLVTMGVLVAFAVADWRSYQRRGTRRGYRPKRTAHERFAAGVDYQRRAARAEPPAAPLPAAPEGDEDDLLRQLLGQ
ncbi:CapA family protein [Oscillochloris sp. ZM17-4]|uniref:CapA family protein n=1 Tax=Oscillochloris sp. ZM17-4 TaxID=2866714 RepID=UPI001C7303BD|nr:CapA family protein [Oscillochloris sp. ZM17-4]MBX0329853.1 CapA family protein [Oscillochloris sp. ZM17-4]